MNTGAVHLLPLAAATLAALLAPGVQAALYRCPSDRGDGDMIITNLLRESDASQRSCELLRPRSSPLDSAAAAAAPRRSAPVRRVAAAETAPDTPTRRIAAPTQRVRDDERRLILETELRNEQSAMSRVRQSAQAAGADETQRREAEQALARHSANVAALQREIARVR